MKASNTLGVVLETAHGNLLLTVSLRWNFDWNPTEEAAGPRSCYFPSLLETPGLYRDLLSGGEERRTKLT